ncbi:MAG: gamma carbonic anhydrase family protein [Deltaproteobacteria bacterium]|nr:gamma carbonic anhydrase family protein [Deltaproteobacteria bacterium]
MITDYKGDAPVIHESAFIAATAVVIGRVAVCEQASVWYGTVVRGDIEPITIGEGTNIQDNCTLHTDTGFPLVIGRNVSVGHNAVVHGCTVEEDCLIGIGAVLLNGAHVKKGCVVAAGSVVRQGQVVGPYEMVAGCPAVVKKKLDRETLRPFLKPAADYLQHAAGHRDIRVIK